MTLFRPCIDLHAGKVKQIVGGSLSDDGARLQTNFVSELAADHYSALYRKDGLSGGHVIALGPGNEAAARGALQAWPQGLHFGGGVTPENAAQWLAWGAEKVIVTSWLFEDGALSQRRLDALAACVPKEQLVIDLSCRRQGGDWFVATQRWQVVTQTRVDKATLEHLARFASEFLVHAADVEGLSQGVDEALIVRLAADSPLPCTYAGGARALEDLQRVAELSQGRVDLTFGSALDLFGGQGVRYADCVAFNRAQGQLPGG